MKIPEAEIKYSRLSLVDIGRVFWWQGRLFRAVFDGSAAAVQRMFDTGLVAKLVSDGLLVNSWLTPYQLDGYALVVEHEVIPVPAYPREWSFSMLKDAALLVLALNDAAKEFGYQTKDCNGYNVLFNGGKPVFVDLGSFVEVAPGEDVLLSYREFLRSYYYPLRIWSLAGQYLGGKVTPRAVGMLLAQEAYLRFRWPIFRHIDDAKLVRWWKRISFVRTLRHQDLDKQRGRIHGWILRLLSLEKAAGLFRGPARIGSLQRKLGKLTHLTGATTWANYHDEFNRGPSLVTTSRFETVFEKLVSLEVGSVLEFAGNQGVLSRMLKQRAPTTRVICTDPDGLAIDKGYTSSRDAAERVEWAIFNPFAYEGSPVEVAPEDRFRADAVVVMALTHHLTLSHNFRLDYIFDVVGRFAERYVFIEFMPLGLHDGTSAPDIPDWYEESWFSEEFCKRFQLLERIQLEPNRILFIGANTARIDQRATATNQQSKAVNHP